MVEMDWKTILSFNHEDITEEDKEKIYESITRVDPGDIEMSFGDMKGLFIVAQEILRYKGDQVQSLTTELDEMAVKQGEMEAELQLNILPRRGSLQYKDLSEKIEEQESVIEANKVVIEKLNLKVLSLEEQISNLLKDKSDDTSSTSDPISEIDRIKDLGDALKKKNGHIRDLLADIQAINEENKALRSKLNHTKEKLSEATFDIKNLSLLVTNSRGENKQLNEHIEKLKNTNASLKDQVNGLMEINKEQDAQLDEFTEQMDSRINQWKNILDVKQSEIENLQSQVAQLQERASTAREQIEPDFFTKALEQREDQIESLQAKLKEATEDILNSTETIEGLKAARAKLEAMVEKLNTGISQDTAEESSAVERIKAELDRYKVDHDDLEECLKIKEAELAEALKLINTFENGECGLKQALEANKRVKQQLKVRDDHIHKLVAENNKYTHILDQMQLENSVMRNKLNLSPERPISTDDIISKHAKRRKDLNSALKKISLMEEQKISLQIQLRQKEKCIKKLSNYIRGLGVKIPEHFLAAILTEEGVTQQAFENDTNINNEGSGDLIDDTISEVQEKEISPVHDKTTNDEEFNLMKENYQHVSDENENLKKGLREIFDAIKEKAMISSSDLTSFCLERLLQALDESRTVRGHSSTGFLEEDILKTMLAETRKEILSTLDLLAKETQKNLELERKLIEIEITKDVPIQEDIKITTDVESIKDPEITKPIDDETNFDFSNATTVKETYLKIADKRHAKFLNNTLKHFHKQFELLHQNMVEIFSQSTAEKNNWLSLEERYKAEIENLSTNLECLKVRLDHVEKSKSLNESTDLSIAEIDVTHLNQIVGEKIYFERRNKYLEDALKFARSNSEDLRLELYDVKKKMYDKLKVYEIDCQKFMFHVADLKNSLRKSVPLDVFLKQNEKMNSYEMKYRMMLNTHEKLEANVENDLMTRAELEILMKKCDILNNEKEELMGILKNERQSSIIAGNLDNVDDAVQSLASSLADSRTEWTMLDQKVKYLESVNSLLSAQAASAHQKLDNASRLLNAANSRIGLLEGQNIKLQEKEMELINKVQQSIALEEGAADIETVNKLTRENEQLQLEYLQLSTELTGLNNRTNDIQHDKLVSDLEMNILRHQILDLQSSNDNKAIIARLSGEILVSHLHTAEMHKKREKLSASLKKERDRIKRLECIIHEKEMQFDNYVSRTNFKISFLSSALQALREQYQCSIPLAVLDNIHSAKEELRLKYRQLETESKDRDNIIGAKNDDNDVQNEPVQNESDALCVHDDMLQCPHFLEMMLKESKWKREKSMMESKLTSLETIREQLESKVDSLEESLLMLTFAFGKTSNQQNVATDDMQTSPFHIGRSSSVVELTDIDSDDINRIHDQQIQKPTPKPRTYIKSSPIHKAKDKIQSVIESDVNLPGSPIKIVEKDLLNSPERMTVVIQTDPEAPRDMEDAICQTDFEVYSISEKERIADEINNLNNRLLISHGDLSKALSLASERAEKVLTLDSEKCVLECKMAALEQLLLDKDKTIEISQREMVEISKKLSAYEAETEKHTYDNEIQQLQKLLQSLKDVEAQKDATIDEFKKLLETEKIEHNETKEIAQKQMFDMRMKLESLEREYNSLKDLMTAPSHIDSYNSTIEKYRGKILELEDRCFQLQRDFENGHAATLSSRSECERWKTLAAERFADLESLSRRLEEKHNDEVGSYRTEASHWLAELNSCKRDVGDLRAEINQNKMSAARQMADREEVIRRLHVVNGNLKQQILNLQTVISASDPTFDLSSITELEEEEDVTMDNALIQTHGLGTDRQSESTNGSMVDLGSNRGAYSERNTVQLSGRMHSVWSDSALDRLRREKQMLGKQNSLLRKQVRVLSARERRSRLESQSFKAQLSRSGVNNTKHFANHEETSFLQRKIEALEVQLSERNAYSSSSNNARAMQIALWDKQKRWQETSERWKQRFQEKCSQLERLERHLEAARVTIQRIEKEKRLLDSRLSKHSRATDGQTPSTTATGDFDNHLELLLRDKERLEEEVRGLRGKLEGSVTQGSLMERLEAQQRRITALELADKGKDVLVSEYERLLEQNALLAKRNLKLESEILDNQLLNLGRRLEPDGSEGENTCCRRNRLQKEHLENYVQLLKEENGQLLSRNIEQPVLDVTSTKTSTVSQAKRVSDLERTVLTLRGLIGGLQAENKRLLMGSGKLKRSPASSDKILEDLKNENEELRNDNEELKKTITDKDVLLERAKLLLRKAIEKEKSLLREISTLKEGIKKI